MFSSAIKAYIDPSSPQVYSNNNDIQFLHANRFLDNYGRLIKGPVLDIGCGDGRLTAFISRQFNVPVTGVDISDARIEYANKTYGSVRIDFHVADAAHINHVPQVYHKQFATIVSFNALHHIPRHLHNLLFWHVWKMLRYDGTALFLIPGRSPELHDAINEAAGSETWKSWFANFDINQVRTYEDPQYYREHCIKTGFFAVEAESVVEEGKELDLKGMKNYLAGWLPQLAHLKTACANEENQQEICDRFLQDVAERYFVKMHKDLSATVKPDITQNRIAAFSKMSFFNYQQSKNRQSEKQEPGEANRPGNKPARRLCARL